MVLWANLHFRCAQSMDLFIGSFRFWMQFVAIYLESLEHPPFFFQHFGDWDYTELRSCVITDILVLLYYTIIYSNNQGGCPGLPITNSLYGLCGHEAILNKL